MRMIGTALCRASIMGAVLVSLSMAAPADPIRQTPTGDDPGQLSALLEALSAFEYSADDAVLHALRAHVRSRRNDPEAMAACETAFIAFLEGQATLAGKQAICRELALTGTERSIPVLERMLAGEETSDMSRRGLEGISGPAADAALLRGLSALRGDPRLGMISSLGNRKCTAAVPALQRLVRSSDEGEAGAAAEALGRIGGPEAARELTAFFPRAPAGIRERVGASLLACADGLLARGDAPGASAAFDSILNAAPTPTLRRAAFKGKVAAAGPDGQALVRAALGGEPPGMVQPAIEMVGAVFDRETVSRACELLPRLREDGQIQLVASLASFPKASVMGTLMKASDAPHAAVRIEALRALGKVGDGSLVHFLAARAAKAEGREKEAARESLRSLGEADVDHAVLEALACVESEAIRLELVRVVGERSIAGSKNILMTLARSDAPATRLLAVQALASVAAAEDLSSLLDLLLAAGDEAEQEAIGNAVASTALAYARPGARADAVEARLAAAGGPEERAALLRVLGKIGEDRSLLLVRGALADAHPVVHDAAARAVAGWPTAVARDDALRIARSSGSLVHRVLALEGFVRMVALERYRAPEGAVASLREALTLAERPEERRLVVSVLPLFACPDGLALAEELSGFPDIGNEARVAAEAVRKELDSRKR